MIFTKEELKFLDMYALCVENKKDNRRDIYGKIVITTIKEKQLVCFSQFSSDAYLYTELQKEVVEDFVLIMPTIQACNLIKLLPESSEIEFTEKGISYKNNKYSFEKEEISFPDITEYINLYKSSKDCIIVKDLFKFNRLKTLMGSYENNTDTIMCNSGKFVTKNSDIISSTTTENDVDLLYYFSKIFINIVIANKLSSLELKKFSFNKEDTYSACKINDTYIFIVDKTYLIPNIFSEQFIEQYNHVNKIDLNKKDLLDSLSRIKLFTNVNLDNRIFIEVVDKYHIKIKTDLENSVVENLSGVFDDILIGKTVIVSSFSLMQVSSDLEGDRVCIYVDEEEESPVVRVEDEHSKDFYILRVFDNDVE